MAKRQISQTDDLQEGAIRAAIARVFRWAMVCFPKRQIYVRSEGRVQFYTVGRGLQASVAGLLAIFLAWVAFSTVTVIFKDRIVAAEDHRFQSTQAAFESQVAALQMSYDELVVSASNAQAYADRQVAAFGHREQELVRQSAPLRDTRHANCVLCIGQDRSHKRHLWKAAWGFRAGTVLARFGAQESTPTVS